ncbi:hypothetical protein BN874_2410002 [Candidatus Contendobacter odensis Run_B_J11]|uniref:Uncharacterized protein n=1 Tax=Candidatus Contendobacter odensis Run_B_J11 TaxID=1400861 RepID=A0A7U7J4K5_9GAMM|nr:hypothetical protein BN874_2410002 [Candidatus Contendobacter odensis Run_B_J11]
MKAYCRSRWLPNLRNHPARRSALRGRCRRRGRSPGLSRQPSRCNGRRPCLDTLVVVVVAGVVAVCGALLLPVKCLVRLGVFLLLPAGAHGVFAARKQLSAPLLSFATMPDRGRLAVAGLSTAASIHHALAPREGAARLQEGCQTHVVGKSNYKRMREANSYEP